MVQFKWTQNNPIKYLDPDGRDIKEIPLYNASAGLIGAVRLTVGVAIDSNANMAVYVKFEGGIGFGVTAVDDSVLNFLGLSKISDIGTLCDNLNVIADTTEILKMLPEDPGKGNLNELPIEDYFLNKIPVSGKNETIKDWKTSPVEAAVIVGAEGDKDGKVSLSLGAKGIAAVYLGSGTVYFKVVNHNQEA